MTGWVERWVARWLRIPAPPSPPWGDPASVRRVAPGPGAVRFEMVHWLIKESWAIAVGVVTIFFPELLPDWRIIAWLSSSWMHRIEVAFFLALPLILPVTFFWAVLTVRARGYILTDRSLRLRDGLWTVREMTISLANVQNVTLKQGLIQRLFGVADVEVRTAGGGDETWEEAGASHRGLLRGLADAETVRDAIVQATRRARAEQSQAEAPAPARSRGPTRVAETLRRAARDLADEARALGRGIEPSR